MRTSQFAILIIIGCSALTFQNCSPSGGFRGSLGVQTESSNGAGVLTPSPPPVVGTGQAVVLNWDVDAGNSQSSFIIESSTDGLNFTQLAEVPGTARSYKARNLGSGLNLTFRIRAVNSVASSEAALVQVSTQ